MVAPLHDIGKIGIPDSILLKPGRLDKEERAVIEMHAAMGYEILRHSERDALQTAATIAMNITNDGTGEVTLKGLKVKESTFTGVSLLSQMFLMHSEPNGYTKMHGHWRNSGASSKRSGAKRLIRD
jgi:hypothetical protein